MYNAEFYNEHNELQKRDVKNCLEEYAKKINWVKEGVRIFDIGSGDGSTTANVLTKYLPKNYKVLIGGDVSENMVQFSNKHYAGDRVSFVKLDIEEDLPEEMEGSFDHVFSFYTFHWVQKQRKAFTNIYKMLDEDGGCLIMVLGYVSIFDMFRILSQDEKWSAYVKNPNKYVSPYHDSKAPEVEIKELMEQIGFKNVDVKKQYTSYIYNKKQDMYNFLKSINPHPIPNDRFDDFLNDCEVILKDLTPSRNTEEWSMEIGYKLMFAMGTK